VRGEKRERDKIIKRRGKEGRGRGKGPRDP